MKRLMLCLVLLLPFSCLAQPGMSGASLLLPGDVGQLELPACLLPVNHLSTKYLPANYSPVSYAIEQGVIEHGGGGCGLFSCFKGSATQDSVSSEQSTRSSRRGKTGAGRNAAGDGGPPDDHGKDKKADYDELLQELERILQILEQLLLSNSPFLVLALDIDKTIRYGRDNARRDQALSARWQQHINAMHQQGRLLLIYNTNRPVNSMPLDWGWSDSSVPAPDILITDGAYVQYSYGVRQRCPELRNGPITAFVWPLPVGGEGGVGVDVSGSCARAVCPGSEQAGQIEQRMLNFCAQRNGVRRLPLQDAHGREVVYSYDRCETKGYALSYVINQLQQPLFGNAEVMLITAGDDLPDASMMNANMRFSFDEIPMAVGLPANVHFLGSVVAHDGNLDIPGLAGLLPQDTTVHASESNLAGILGEIVKLLRRYLSPGE